MRAAGLLGARAVTIHVGSHTGSGFEAARPRVARALERILEAGDGSCPLLLENSAGSGGNIGSNFAELGAIIDDQGRPSMMGICLDSAHAYAAGYDLRDRDAVRSMVDEIERRVGFDRLAVIHVNDSRTGLGSRVDRHDNIGAGEIGIRGFANVLGMTELARLPLILETPNLEKRPADVAALRRSRTRGLRDESTVRRKGW